MVTTLDRKTFIDLPIDEILRINKEMSSPRLGVFVPDGNRRLVLAQTNLQPGTEEFYSQVAVTQTRLGLESFKVFFTHGLPVLFVPIFSSSVLGRGPDYRRFTVLPTLQIMFTSQEWLDFYKTLGVRIYIYGNPRTLRDYECEAALEWIEQAQYATRQNTLHSLYLGIGGDPYVGWDAALGAAHYQETCNQPLTLSTLTEFMYGQPLPLADFVIFSGLLGGLGALPALICGRGTRVYQLPTPGVASLIPLTYRAILHDLIFTQETAVQESSQQITAIERRALSEWYDEHSQEIIGLGRVMGPVWVPEDEHGPGL